jgi:hypothetical protein
MVLLLRRLNFGGPSAGVPNSLLTPSSFPAFSIISATESGTLFSFSSVKLEKYSKI